MEALQCMSSTHYVFQSGIVVISQDILMDLKGLSYRYTIEVKLS